MHILHLSCLQRTTDGLSVYLSAKCMSIPLIHCHFQSQEVVDQMVRIVVVSAKKCYVLHEFFVNQDYCAGWIFTV